MCQSTKHCLSQLMPKIFHPATYEEHPINNHDPDHVPFWKSCHEWILGYGKKCRISWVEWDAVGKNPSWHNSTKTDSIAWEALCICLTHTVLVCWVCLVPGRGSGQDSQRRKGIEHRTIEQDVEHQFLRAWTVGSHGNLPMEWWCIQKLEL